MRFYFYDWISVRLADKVILDTQENIDYFIKKYKARRNKFFELPVTADPDIFKTSPHKKHKVLTAGFYGSFMPLHGADTIVDAANILKTEKIKFYLLGIGPGALKIKKKIKNLGISNKVVFENKKIAYNQLPRFLAKIDLFLAGPFGETDKAKRVLPAKAVEALKAGGVIVYPTDTIYGLGADAFSREAVEKVFVCHSRCIPIPERFKTIYFDNIIT